MSQVRKLQTGGTVDKQEENQYTVKINGNKLNLGHEQLQGWFNDYMKAGGGKTKNRDEWNSDFNEILGSIKASNAKGETFDFDLQGDTVGAIDYTGSKDDYSNEQLGLKDDGKNAKAGLFSGVTGVKNKAAMRGSLLQGLADYSAKSYVATVADTKRIASETEAKNKIEADKVKAEGLKNYNTRLSQFDKDMTPESNWKNIDGTNPSIDYALKQYHTLNDAGKRNLTDTWGNKLHANFSSLYNEAQSNPEYLKIFQGKFGNDVSGRLAQKGTDFIKNAAPESFNKFTDKATYDKLVQSTATPAVFKPNADGTFTGADGKLYTDAEGKLLLNAVLGDKRYTNGMLTQGEFEKLFYKDGKTLEGEIDGIKYGGGLKLTQFDLPQGRDLTSLNRLNFRTMPMRLDGKLVNFNDYVKAIGEDKTGKYTNALNQFNKVLNQVRLTDEEIKSKFIQRREDNGKNKLDSNAYDPYEGIPDKDIPKYYRNYTGLYSNFGPEKGAILEEYTGQIDPVLGIPKTRMIIRRPGKGVELLIGIESNAYGIQTAITKNGERIYLGRGGTEKDLTKSRYGFSAQKNRSLTNKRNVVPSKMFYMKDGGNIDKLKILKAQGGVYFDPTKMDLAGQGTKAKYREVGSEVFDKNYTMSATDKYQLAALVADIGSLAMTAAPGVGNVAAAGVGAAGTVTNFLANVSKDGFQGSDVLEGAIGLGLDTLTLLPGLGTGAKSAKILRALKTSSKAIGAALGAVGAYQASDSLAKILKGDSTIDDWRHLATGLTGAISGKRLVFDDMLATSKGTVTKYIKNAQGEKFNLDPKTSSLISGAKTTEDKAKIAKTFIADKLNAANPATPVTIDDVALEQGFGLKGWNLPGKVDKIKVGSDTGESILDPISKDGTLGSWIKNRAIKRVAMGNPNMQGADDVLGNGNKLGTTFWGRKFAWTPSGNIKSTSKESADAVEDVVKQTGRTAKIEGTPRNVKMPKAYSNEPSVKSADDGLKPDKTSLPSNEASLLPEPKVTSLAEAEIKAKSNKLMNLYLNRKPKLKTDAGKDAKYIAPTKSVNPDKTITFDEARKITKAEKVKEIQESTKNIVKETNTNELRKLRKQIGLSTNKEHTIELDKVFSPKKGTIEETTSKKLLKNKKIAAMLEKAIDEGKTSIKLAKGGIIKAQLGVKVNSREDELLASIKRMGIQSLPINQASTKINSIGTIQNYLNKPKNPLNFQIANTTKDIRTPLKLKTVNLNKSFGDDVPDGVDPPKDETSLIRKPTSWIDKDTASELGRALFNREITRNVDTRVDVPLATHVTEVGVPIKGDMLLSSAYNKAADNVVQDMGRAKTSDSGLELAGRLAGNKQASDLRLQGDAANAEAIARSEAASIQSQQQYAGARQAVTNANSSALASKTQTERGLKNQKMLAMGKSLDNFWASQNQKNEMKTTQNQAYDRDLAYMQLESKYSPELTKASTDYDLATTALNTAKNANDQVGIDAATKTLNEVKLRGDRMNRNMQYLRLQLSKNPNWSGLNDFDINSDTFGNSPTRDTSSGVVFKMGRMASGGKLSIEDKIAIEEYKQANKNFKSNTDTYNKWMALRMKEDNKELSDNAKQINKMISEALKTK